MSSAVDTRAAGWRPDPSGRYEWRYWDNGWTNRVANSTSPKPATRRAAPPAPRRAIAPGAATTEPPASQSEAAVMRAVAAGRGASAARAIAAAPAVSPPPYPPPAPPAPAEGRSGLVASVVRWFQSFADEEESYHSPKAGVALDPHPRGNSLLAAGPANYGQAGLVVLAAFGLGVGAYLPWLSGTVGFASFERTGFDLGRAAGFTWLAAVITVTALLAVRMRPLRWASMGLAVVAAVLMTRELIDVHELVLSMNRARTVHAEIGVGIWIMLAATAGVLVASFRTTAPD